LISLGGGSSHDCGKGIGLVVANGGKIHDFEGVDKSTKPMPPYLAVNTTAGTASEMTRFCIITDTSRKVKMAIVDWRVTPGIAIDDPMLMVGMPPALTAATGMDALTHAVESYVSLIAHTLTETQALKAMHLILDNLKPALKTRDPLAMENLSMAAVCAGMSFSNASLGACHAIAHSLGGFFDTTHGMVHPVLLPAVMSYNLPACEEKMAISQIWGKADSSSTISRK